ncbi:MAG: carboxypeptidase-like regulatory domain-containing protein [Planctomycetota bacterium]
MRILTGSVLALLVGGVAYMNLTTPPMDDAVEPPAGGAAQGAAEQGRADDTTTGAAGEDLLGLGAGRGSGSTEAAGAPEAADAERVSIVPVIASEGGAASAVDRIALGGPGLERSTGPSPAAERAPGELVPKLESFDPARDIARAREGAPNPADVASSPEGARTPGQLALDDLLGAGPKRSGAGAQDAPKVGAAGGRAPVTGRVVTSLGAVLTGVQLEVVPQGDNEVVAAAATDDVGVFSFTGIEPGLYQLRVVPGSVPGGYVAPWYPDLCRGAAMPLGVGSPCFAVLADGSANTNDIVLVRPGSVAGRVYGGDGAPASDALVRLAADAPGLETCRVVTQTDARGDYRFEVAPGKYRLEVGFRPDGPNRGLPAFEPRALIVAEGEAATMPTLRATALTAAAEQPLEAPPSNGAAPAAGLAARTEPVAPSQRASRSGLVAVDLFGRVLSTFGEPLSGVEVLVLEGGSSAARGVATTDVDGEWSISGATGADLRIVARGERLLASSDPQAIVVQEGQRRVRVPDLLVEVRRVFQLEGQVVVADEELDAYHDELIARMGKGAALDPDQVRRAYMRGLRLEQRTVGSRRGRMLRINEDGSFAWSCALPADDVEFILEARGLRTGGRASKTRLVVTPAGDRTVRAVLPFPARETIELAPETGSPAEVERPIAVQLPEEGGA